MSGRTASENFHAQTNAAALSRMCTGWSRSAATAAAMPLLQLSLKCTQPNTSHKPSVVLLSLYHCEVDTLLTWTGFCCSAMYQSKSSLEVAVEAAARVDAVLAKKGKIKPNPIATAVSLKYQIQIYVASKFVVWLYGLVQNRLCKTNNVPIMRFFNAMSAMDI